jgi:hypothetical protein
LLLVLLHKLLKQLLLLQNDMLLQLMNGVGINLVVHQVGLGLVGSRTNLNHGRWLAKVALPNLRTVELRLNCLLHLVFL